MYLFDCVRRLIQLDNDRRNVVNTPNENNKMQMLYNYHFNQFVKYSNDASEEEKTKIMDYLNELMEKYEKVITHLEEQEELYTNRDDIKHYINGKKLETQFKIISIDEIKKVMTKENTK